MILTVIFLLFAFPRIVFYSLLGDLLTFQTLLEASNPLSKTCTQVRNSITTKNDQSNHQDHQQIRSRKHTSSYLKSPKVTIKGISYRPFIKHSEIMFESLFSPRGCCLRHRFSSIPRPWAGGLWVVPTRRRR